LKGERIFPAVLSYRLLNFLTARFILHAPGRFISWQSHGGKHCINSCRLVLHSLIIFVIPSLSYG
jgi:hypothetical protein